ncbi:hypothetical protein LZ32DRAFT_132309 [Colletotrichum eremochloae]|nr:hypothetical protein LZ32DRAFT_132309 [Colletotrichum eremochloae]
MSQLTAPITYDFHSHQLSLHTPHRVAPPARPDCSATPGAGSSDPSTFPTPQPFRAAPNTSPSMLGRATFCPKTHSGFEKSGKIRATPPARPLTASACPSICGATCLRGHSRA